MSRDLTLDIAMPGRRFTPYKDGFLFLSHRLSSGTSIKAIEKEEYNLGLVEFHELTIGEGGVTCGYFFHTTHLTKHAPNFLTVYRKKLIQRSSKELLGDPGTKMVLKYRPPMLRIFTMRSDLVVIGSDIPDRMKAKLENQD